MSFSWFWFFLSLCRSSMAECTPLVIPRLVLSWGRVRLRSVSEFQSELSAGQFSRWVFSLQSWQLLEQKYLNTFCLQGRGRYVNHVVIQANPVIMQVGQNFSLFSSIWQKYSQDTDKTVRIECVFTADDQTVSFRPTAGAREDGGGISVTWVSSQLLVLI